MKSPLFSSPFALLLLILVVLVIGFSLSGADSNGAEENEAFPVRSITFAIIGDYGFSDLGPYEGDVAALVKNWNPDFIITTGDNNYDFGGEDTIDKNIGQYYHKFISPYFGAYGPGATVNRFFPSMGNHDWYTPGAAPYLPISPCLTMNATTTSYGDQYISS